MCTGMLWQMTFQIAGHLNLVKNRNESQVSVEVIPNPDCLSYLRRASFEFHRLTGYSVRLPLYINTSAEEGISITPLFLGRMHVLATEPFPPYANPHS